MPLRKFSRMRNYQISKTATAGPGADSAACSSIVTSRAQRAWPRSAASMLQAAAETSGKEDSIASCSSSSSLQRGWSGRMATRWSSHRPACSVRYRSPHVSSSANDSFKKFTGAHSRRPPPFTLFARSLRQNRRSSFYSGRGENLVTIASRTREKSLLKKALNLVESFKISWWLFRG